MALLSKLNVKPFRIAFDRVKEKQIYLNAIRTAMRYGVTEFSNYMLFNWHDTPKDLYERLIINIGLNAEWQKCEMGIPKAAIYSYPMRYAPINGEVNTPHVYRYRDLITPIPKDKIDFLNNPIWTSRFIRNVEIMKGAVHGAISPTPTLALRTLGKSFEEFIANLYMPEILLRNRNKHEKKIYKREPKRRPGSGEVEQFRRFILRKLRKPNQEFLNFNEAISKNTSRAVREFLKQCTNKEMRKWLKFYLQR
jgi:hypothetical protein